MQKRILKIILAQINPIVGDIFYNTNKIINIIQNNQNADLIVFPEMSLVGYPLMDHIFDPLIQKENNESIEKLKKVNSKAVVIIGTFTEPEKLKKKIQPFYNSALVIKGNEIIHIENKRLLPNYDVFDERRYFLFDDDYTIFEIKGIKIGILICEDVWDNFYDIKVAKNLVNNGAEILIVINASPFYINKYKIRRELITNKAKNLSVPIVYLNMVGGLDEIVYDGGSFVSNKYGQIIYKSKSFEEECSLIEIAIDNDKPIEEISYDTDWREDVLKALRLNLYDYFFKSNIFEGVVLGLSGGIDSAFTAYICATVLNPNKVNAIMMPTRYTSKESIDLARTLCENLKIKYIIHPIDTLFESYEKNLQNNLGKLPFDIADENLQARIRATILMYYSNKFNWLLVSTGNKSEIGVGYCTLYGDTCGGKNIPGDLFKIQIYDICNWINKDKEIIPNGIITRPPTAELKENQKDSDSLPQYEKLDLILKEIIDNGLGTENKKLIEKGFDLDTIRNVERLYLNSEYKRRQLVQSIKVNESAFGTGRRYPVLKRIKL
jgi:NAD+ synthase (glutamine-hydrolysing)